jgi:hypothetical protein
MLFAEDVRNDRPDLRVDTEKALAALKERDYAGFIAHGLKIGSTSNSGNFEYSRVVNIRDNVTDVKDWSYTKNVSLNRTITKLIQVDLQERKPYVGMCDAINVWLNLPLLDPDNMVRMHPGSYFVPTCLLEGGAMLRAGFQPGVLIQRINGRTVNSLNNLEAALDVSPGDTVPVEYLQFVQGPWGPYYEQKTIDVRPGAGAVR